MPAGKQLSDLNPSGTSLGQTTADLISLYGVTPVSQRASSIQAASVVSANSFISVTSNLAAFCAEVAATLTALGGWKGAA
jgi:hypothetical protein